MEAKNRSKPLFSTALGIRLLVIEVLRRYYTRARNLVNSISGFTRRTGNSDSIGCPGWQLS